MRPLPRSLFFKLFAIFGLMFFLLIVVVWAGLTGGFMWAKNQFLQKNLQKYGSYLAQDLGDPPDPARMQALSEALGLYMVWEPTSTSPTSGNPDQTNRPKHPLREHFSFTTHTPLGTLTIFPGGPMATLGWEGTLIILPFLVLVVLFGWWLVTLILAPLKQMRLLAASFGLRDWKARVPVRGQDELADLAQSFNAMADRIEGYWESQRSLLAAVSHELRSPLTRMRVALEFVGEKKIRESLKEEIERLDRMTGILLERERLAQRPDLLTLETTDFGPWVEEVLDSYRKLGLEVTGSGPALQAVFDRGRLALVLSNLLENILKHAPGSSAVVRWSEVENQLALEIEDAGPGLSGQALSRWGEPFRGSLVPGHALKEPGFGLGSSLVKSIVEAHGGRVALRTASPSGLIVEVRLPPRR